MEITKDPHAVMEYLRYETAVVQQYHVKLIGWTHPEWANPSDLKGGLEALEYLAEAISTTNICKFVRITREEVDERKRRIAAGEVMTPNREPHQPTLASVIGSNTQSGQDPIGATTVNTSEPGYLDRDLQPR